MEDQNQNLNATPTSAPQQPVPKTKRRSIVNSKWLMLAIFAVILIIFVGGGAYLLGKNNSSPKTATITQNPTSTPTTTPAPTANWKTYQGNGFSFKYPKDWTQNDSGGIEMPADPSCPHCAPGPGNIAITAYDNPNSQSIAGFLTSFANVNQSLGGDYFTKQFKSYSISDVKESMLNTAMPGAWNIQEAALLNSGKSVVVLYCTSSVCTENNNFEQILSTFKFTNTQSQNVTPTTSETDLATETVTYALNTNWQTYADNPAAYELRFPPGYQINSSSEIGKTLYILNCTGGNCSTGYSVIIHNDYNGGSRRVWFNSKHPDSLVNPYYENLVVQGVNGLLIMDGNSSGSTGSFVLVPRGSRVYEFSFPSGWNPQTGEKSGLPFIKDVLSTFKFL